MPVGGFVEYACEHLPEIGFLFVCRLILEVESPRSVVSLDISDLVRNGRSPEKVIEGGIDAVVAKVVAYERTFDALRGRRTTIGRELTRHRLHSAWNRVQTGATPNQRGTDLEACVAELFEAVEGLTIVDRRLRLEDQEIDLVLKNSIQGPFWNHLGCPIILVECKNWNTPAGAPEARVFESKLRELGPTGGLGIFVAVEGATAGFRSVFSKVRRDGAYGVLVEGADVVRALEDPGLNVKAWLEDLVARQLAGG